MNNESLIEAFKSTWEALIQCSYLLPNNRVIHLATHAKKKRVRKKNLKRVENCFSG